MYLPLMFLMDAALEMVILMQFESCCARETYQSGCRGRSPSPPTCCAQMDRQLVQPLAPHLLAASKGIKNTLEKRVFRHCLVLCPSADLHARPVILGWCLAEFLRGPKVYKNLENRRQESAHCETNHSRVPLALRLLLLRALVVLCGTGPGGRGLGSRWAARRRLNVLRLGVLRELPPTLTQYSAPGSAGAGCPSWARASTVTSSPAHTSSNRARHCSVWCWLFRKQAPQCSDGLQRSVKARVMA